MRATKLSDDVMTTIVRFGIPVLLLIGGAVQFVWLTNHGVSQMEKAVFATVDLISFVVLLYRGSRYYDVWLDGSELLMNSYGRTVRVPLSAVRYIEASQWIARPQFVVVRYRGIGPVLVEGKFIPSDSLSLGRSAAVAATLKQIIADTSTSNKTARTRD